MADILVSIFKFVWHALCGPSKEHEQEQPHLPAQQEPVSYPPPHHQQQQEYGPSRRLFGPPQDDPWFLDTRRRANDEGEMMARCFQESHEAYERGDGALAKQLSDRGKEHKAEMERLHKQASTWIYSELNKDRAPGEIDLHCLFVQEAIDRTDQAIREAQRSGITELHLIVGRGLHSRDGPKIRPAIEGLIRKHQLVAELDPQNSGVLLVTLGGHSCGVGPVVDPDEITRHIERDDKECVIM